MKNSKSATNTALTAVVAVLTLLCTSSAFAQATGKIAGNITDKNTGDPIIGASVLIVGTPMGAATDMNGNYFILQVPTGAHELKISSVGYATVIVKDVRVDQGLTKTVNVQMVPKSLHLNEVVVQAPNPIVKPDVTTSEKLYTRQEMASAPGVQGALDVFKMQGGVFVNPAPPMVNLGNGMQLQPTNESVNSISINGSRGGQILFLVDGMPVTQPLYGGSSALNLNVNDVSSIELLTGAYNAEYGQAQAGVVSITTRAGGNTYKGGFQLKTDEPGLWGASYQTQYATFYLGGPEYLTRTLLPELGVRIPGKMSFFVSGNGNITNTPYDNHRKRSDISLLGLKFPDRQDNTAGLDGRLDWDASHTFRVTADYHGEWHKWSAFDWLWQKIPNHMTGYDQSTQNMMLMVHQTISNSTFYNLNFGWLGINYNASLGGTNPSQFWTLYADSAGYANHQGYTYDQWKELFGSAYPYEIASSASATTIDPSTGLMTNNSYETLWHNDLTSSFTLKGDISSQVNSSNFIKAGFTYEYQDLHYTDIEDGGTALSTYGNQVFGLDTSLNVPRPPGPFPEFGQYRWVFHAQPIIGGAYIEDKFERPTLVINVGARVDWFMPGQSVFDPGWDKQWETATGLPANWNRFRYKISPRLGISYPIDVNTDLFFSYGYFYQLPELVFFYQDPYTSNLVGNPGLDFEQTIQYEFGLTRALGTNWALKIKTFSKDISRQVGSTQLKPAGGVAVSVYDNNGYARARGVQLTLTKRPSGYLSGYLTYTLQWAYGYSSSAFADYIRSFTDLPNPIRETRLDWDIRHQVILVANFGAGKGQHLNLFGLRLPDLWSISVLSRLSSGQPYTPGTYDPIQQQLLTNSATGPPTYETDLKLTKSFNLGGNLDLGFYLDVYNLFDQRNVQIAFGFNPWTGQPYRYGDLQPLTDEGYNWAQIYPLLDPRQFSTGRYTDFGVSLDF